MRIGLIKERKTPSDHRVVLTPAQCVVARQQFPGLEIIIESSSVRCYTDDEYARIGIETSDDLTACNVLVGVKEVPVASLNSGKTYIFFSHTIKGQEYNMPLLKAVLEQSITLIDFECLTDENGARVIAFGLWAGIVGAHNGLLAWGRRTGLYNWPRVLSFRDYDGLRAFYAGASLPPVKIAVTGTGRVAQGAVEVMEALEVTRVEQGAFLTGNHDQAVYAQLDSAHLYRRASDAGFSREELHANPGIYVNAFKPYTHVTDVLINAMYWEPRAPRLFSLDDMKSPTFRIRTVADITCDIGGSVPATKRVTTIDDPVFGYDPINGGITKPFLPTSIDIMAVDNLPNELPRDASESFGEMFLKHVSPDLMKPDSRMLSKATIAKQGQLTEAFAYLGKRLP